MLGANAFGWAYPAQGFAGSGSAPDPPAPPGPAFVGVRARLSQLDSRTADFADVHAYVAGLAETSVRVADFSE